MKSNRRFLPIFISVIIAVIIVIACSWFMDNKTAYNMKSLEDNWDISINDDIYQNISIKNFYITSSSPLEKGDEIIMSITLPDIGYIPYPIILFKSQYTTLNCYIDEEKVYEFGEREYLKEQFIGKIYHIITLPRDYSGKKLTIKMTATEQNAFSHFNIPVFGNQPDVEGELINSNLIVITTAVFIFIFGIILLFVSLLFATVIPRIITQILEALFCMNLGAWMLSYFNLLTLFYYTPFETQIEFFTLYLIVPYCYLILMSLQGIRKKPAFYAALILQSIMTIGIYIAHYVLNLHMRYALPLYHITGIIGFFVLIYFMINNVKKHNLHPSDMVQMLGLTIFAIDMLLQLVVYSFDKVHITVPAFLNKTLMSMGCLLFVICLLSNYLIYITQTYAHKKEYASLAHLAYADGLTDLPNRALSDKQLAELNNVKTDYCIISIDLNGLKTVNDKFGHLTGDKYIKDFSKILTNTFEDNDFFARIGGDEFLAIIKDATGRDVPTILDRIDSALNVLNAIYSEYHRSVATGFAYRHEVENGDSHEVYLLADQRMYENKKIMHERLGIISRL